MSAHEAPGHALPTSNGYGSHTRYNDDGTAVTEVGVWCGRCRAEFTPDPAWVRRYYAAHRARIEATPPPYPGWYESALDGIDRDEARLLELLGPDPDLDEVIR